MTRILVLSPYEPPSDGIARHTAHLVAAWDSAGHSVMVVSPVKESPAAKEEPIGSRSKVVRTLRIIPRRRTWQDLAEFEPDVVFVQFAVSALSVNYWSFRSLCKKFRALHIPVVVAYHEPAREYDLLGLVTRRMYQAMARVTSVPIAFSFAGAQTLVDSGLFESVVEVPHGTTGVATITDADTERVRKRYGVHASLVLSLGFTSADKGTDVLLDAAADIAGRRAGRVQFLIAGSPRERRGLFKIMGRRDVAYQQRLQSQARAISNVEIAFHGFVADEDVAALLHEADVVALPYRNITQSGIANLALSSRSVVVASDLPGLRSDLGDAAQYVKAGDPHALAQEIAALLDDAAFPLRQQMRESSGDRALSNTYEKVAERILSAATVDGGATQA
jgi:glycosyltransferase involved in cell wall biosynthesis